MDEDEDEVEEVSKEQEMVSRLRTAVRSGNVGEFRNVAEELAEELAENEYMDEVMELKEAILSIHDNIGETALHWAAAEGKKEICEYLIEDLKFDPDLKASPHLKKVVLCKEGTPLLCSTVHSQVNTMRYLIDKGADLNARAFCGLTHLHAAVMHNQVEALRVLLGYQGVEVDASHPLGTPLLIATAKDDDIMLHLLLGHKANPNLDYTQMMGSEFITPLVVSVLNGSIKCTRLLIGAGAEVNKQPLVEMALGSIDLLNHLLECGADPNIRNQFGQLPIEVAAIRNLREVVEILLPLTSPIETVPVWTIEGLFSYVKSQSFIKMDKMSNFKQKIEAMTINSVYTSARYLCFYALQEDPNDAVVANHFLYRLPGPTFELVYFFFGAHRFQEGKKKREIIEKEKKKTKENTENEQEKEEDIEKEREMAKENIKTKQEKTEENNRKRKIED